MHSHSIEKILLNRTRFSNLPPCWFPPFDMAAGESTFVELGFY